MPMFLKVKELSSQVGQKKKKYKHLLRKVRLIKQREY